MIIVLISKISFLSLITVSKTNPNIVSKKKSNRQNISSKKPFCQHTLGQISNFINLEPLQTELYITFSVF